MLSNCFFCHYTPPHNSGEVLPPQWQGIMVSQLSMCPSICRTSIRPSVPISFTDDNLNKYQWLFTKLGVCIEIVAIWFEIAKGQISSVFDRVICPSVFSFPDDNFNK